MLEDYEALLGTAPFEPPDDFVVRLMARVEAAPAPVFEPIAPAKWERIQWLALAGTALLGAIQLAAFMFGIWSATAAG